MAKSDDGHYELVLGNRQLVSGFFVLVILFAIFLTLGYILGRNSVVVSEPATVAGETTSPVVAAPVQPASATGRPSASETAVEPTAVATTTPAPETTTQPAQTPPVPEAKPEPPAAAKPAPTATVTPQPAASATTDRSRQILAGKVQLITPRKGDVFLQVAAIGRAEAELMAEQLQKRSYRAFLSEVPGKDLFRVLIGPFETAPRLNDTKKKLADEGMPSIVQRY
jgi:septal ring-binding cell division protein DamX